MIKRIYFYLKDTFLFVPVAAKSTVGKNAFSLYTIQFADFILPLITIPYVVRVIGPAGFGVVGFCQGLVAYFQAIVDYGFSLSATRVISVHREDSKKIDEYASAVLLAKFLLFIIGGIVLLLLVSFINTLDSHKAIFILLYAGILGNVLFPIWLFQGLEKMASLAKINLFFRALMVLLIFLLVRGGNDSAVLIYVSILSTISILSGLLGLIIAKVQFKLSFMLVSFSSLIEVFKDGWSLFLSNVSISLFTAGNSFILGLFASPTVVGYYAAGEKIVRASFGFVLPAIQAAYPMFAKVAVESKENLFHLSKKIGVLVGGIGLLITLLFLAFPRLIISLVLGREFIGSLPVLMILSPLPMVIAIGNVLSTQIILPLKKDKDFTKILLFGGVLNIVLSFLLSPFLKANGSSIAYLSSELGIVVLEIFLISKKLRPNVIKG